MVLNGFWGPLFGGDSCYMRIFWSIKRLIGMHFGVLFHYIVGRVVAAFTKIRILPRTILFFEWLMPRNCIGSAYSPKWRGNGNVL